MIDAPPTPSRPARAIALELRRGGIRSWISGESLRRAFENPSCRELPAVRGLPETGLELVAECNLRELLAALPNAVPIRPEENIALAASATQPIEVRCLGDEALVDHLEQRDFSVHAIAWDPVEESLQDPLSGRSHIAEKILHATPNCGGALAALRGVRAARLTAWGYRVAPALRDELREKSRSGPLGSRAHVGRELTRMLMSPHPEHGIEWLRQCELHTRIVGLGRKPATRGLDNLPLRLPLRVAAMLGPSATRSARKLGFPPSVLRDVERIGRNHPLDARVDPRRLASLRRLARSLRPGELDDLVLLRELELRETSGVENAEQSLRALWTTRDAILSLAAEPPQASFELALDGREVMAALDCGPGPRVGRALGWLREQVSKDPQLNSPEKLRSLLANRRAEPSSKGDSG